MLHVSIPSCVSVPQLRRYTPRLGLKYEWSRLDYCCAPVTLKHLALKYSTLLEADDKVP